jgi:hypothetical protein
MTGKNEKPKKRKLKSNKRPIRLRLTNVRNDPEKRNQLYDEAESRSTLGKYQLAAGTWQHPRTKLWQVWMSSYGTDINWISAHHDPDCAQQDVNEIKAAGQRGDLSDENKVVTLFERLEAGGDEEPENVSAADIAKITASIGERVFEAQQPGQVTKEEQKPENFSIVLAELTPGKVSVGFRLGQEDMVDLFAEDLSPQEAAKLAANIAQGSIDLEELSRRPMREIYFPVDQAEPQPSLAIDYRYTLPGDDAEVVVSGASMAIIDLAKKPPLADAHAIQERALWHCEMSRQHIRVGELTNDYEGFKHLFIESYTTIYERDPEGLTEAARSIMTRYDLETVLIEIRNIIKALYFPDLADLEQLKMEYKGVLITPQHSFDGYYATFLWQQIVTRTQNLASPMLAIAQARQMIDKEEKE